MIYQRSHTLFKGPDNASKINAMSVKSFEFKSHDLTLSQTSPDFYVSAIQVQR